MNEFAEALVAISQCFGASLEVQPYGLGWMRVIVRSHIYSSDDTAEMSIMCPMAYPTPVNRIKDCAIHLSTFLDVYSHNRALHLDASGEDSKHDWSLIERKL